MSNSTPPARSMRERIWAAVAHACILTWFSPLSCLPGIITSIFIWYRHRQQDPWIAFHALQALAYQIALTLLFVPVMILLYVVCQPTIGPACAGLDPNLIGRLWLWIFCGLPLLALFSLFGAVRILLGKDFGYPLIAGTLRARLKLS